MSVEKNGKGCIVLYCIVSWVDKRTNEQVLSSMDEKRRLIETVWDRKKNWIGHVVRGDSLMKLVLEGRE